MNRAFFQKISPLTAVVAAALHAGGQQLNSPLASVYPWYALVAVGALGVTVFLAFTDPPKPGT